MTEFSFFGSTNPDYAYIHVSKPIHCQIKNN